MGMPLHDGDNTIVTTSPVILDRTTTIDGIILASYYDYLKSRGKVLPFDKEHSTVDFIEKKNGVFSGSIWYIDKDADIAFDFETFVKKPEHRKVQDSTNKPVRNNKLFKAYLGTDETMLVDKLHFYIRAKKEIVEKLLIGKVFAIGKKQGVGFGVVRDIEVEEIEEDRGYMLNDSTPSKPLPTSDFSVKTKKIAHMRRMPPYWLQEYLEPCYMPTTALYEMSDNTMSRNDFVYTKERYLNNCNFLYKYSKGKGVSFKDIPMNNIAKALKSKKVESVWTTENSTKKCSVTGCVSNVGVENNIQTFMRKLKSSFTDYNYFKNEDFLSDEALWCIENISEIANSYVDKKSWLYLRGKVAQDGTRYRDFVKNPMMLQPPFSINLKDTQNAQHVSFKGKVSISNAYFTVQFGNNQLHIDNELLQEAIDEVKTISAENKITKNHLCGNFEKNNSSHIPLKKQNNNAENSKVILDFQKRYNSHIRFLLSSVKLD